MSYGGQEALERLREFSGTAHPADEVDIEGDGSGQALPPAERLERSNARFLFERLGEDEQGTTPPCAR